MSGNSQIGAYMPKYRKMLICLAVIAISGYGFYKLHTLDNKIMQLQQQNTDLENRLNLVSDALATNVELVDRLEAIISKKGVNQ